MPRDLAAADIYTAPVDPKRGRKRARARGRVTTFVQRLRGETAADLPPGWAPGPKPRPARPLTEREEARIRLGRRMLAAPGAPSHPADSPLAQRDVRRRPDGRISHVRCSKDLCQRMVQLEAPAPVGAVVPPVVLCDRHARLYGIRLAPLPPPAASAAAAAKPRPPSPDAPEKSFWARIGAPAGMVDRRRARPVVSVLASLSLSHSPSASDEDEDESSEGEDEPLSPARPRTADAALGAAGEVASCGRKLADGRFWLLRAALTARGDEVELVGLSRGGAQLQLVTPVAAVPEGGLHELLRQVNATAAGDELLLRGPDAWTTSSASDLAAATVFSPRAIAPPQAPPPPSAASSSASSDTKARRRASTTTVAPAAVAMPVMTLVVR